MLVYTKASVGWVLTPLPFLLHSAGLNVSGIFIGASGICMLRPIGASGPACTREVRAAPSTLLQSANDESCPGRVAGSCADHVAG